MFYIYIVNKLIPFFAFVASLLFLTLVSCEKETTPSETGDETLILLDDEDILKQVVHSPNTAFYKDIFLDGGCELNPGIKENGVVINGRLPYALEKAEIKEAEYFLATVDDVANGYTDSDQLLQNKIFSGTPDDINGVLLYPDGEPRYRLFYSFGGHSGPHGRTLGTSGRENVNTFYRNGGSYVGSCAGAYLAGKYASGSLSSYYNIWEGGNMKGTGVSNSSIEIVMETDIFQEKYYGPSYHSLIAGVRHNGGGYMDVNMAPVGTEILGRFKNQKGKDSSSKGFFDQPGIWAYKKSDETGRLVVTGSHPEDAASGAILNMTASMFRYAWDGVGDAKVKAVLHNGEYIYMSRKTTDCKPQRTRIGDLQCHHFVLWLAAGVPSLELQMKGEGDYRMELYLKKDDFAFPDNEPDYSAVTPANSQTIVTGPLDKGLWYVTVRCASTVTATENYIDKDKKLGRYFVYSGDCGVLNGVPYSIVAKW
ncbi:MAG: hypothetical protein II652_06750 [Bacteroidales bacterium]|nr:hypothetical protein [Bacteroidales bacterium]MBQ4299645.1 hypothetical protein [Bacteroidales bacterium]